ncbi:MAG: o-succinylbenzoate synthase [Bacteroidia bacterium]|nr:o-succinylbenzoate synthase [Bacteroidia bacterium]
MIKCEVEHISLAFKQPARTSRGEYLTHDSWMLKLTDDRGRVGVGEAAPLPDLSSDAGEDYEERIREFAANLQERGGVIDYERYRRSPSMLFAAESAHRMLEGDSMQIATDPVQINGLIWMGDLETMKKRVDEKLAARFRCIKIKVGGLDFEKELELIRYLRHNPHHPEWGREVELRLDANCAFGIEEAMQKLDKLSSFGVHSIEQPIKVRQWEQLSRLCKESPIPIALDEELIGLFTREEKEQMLEAVRPQAIVIKPTLHGGLSGAEEWIQLCAKYGIDWWVTSALESNIGLGAIADWLHTQQYQGKAHGLGTGLLYKTNYPSSYQLRGDEMVKNSI